MAALVAAFVDTLSILMIVFGAIFLYHTMEEKGYIASIKTSLHGIHPERHLQFYFIVFFLTAFFESVAGFGTPGAIVPLILISMGFPPVASICAVLLIDGLFAVSGAIGTPVTIGFLKPLGLSVGLAEEIYFYAGIFVACSGLVVHFFVARQVPTFKARLSAFIIFLSIMVPFAALSSILQELSGLISAIIMAIISFSLFFSYKQVQWKAWLPYLLLVSILLLPKIFPTISSLIAFRLSYENIFGTKVSASLAPLGSPFLPFIIASVFAAWLAKSFSFNLKPVFSRTIAVFLILLPSLAITRFMIASGTSMPSMVDTLASIFVETGSAYPLLSPLIGIIGTFITGSTTVSNIIFGPMQYNTAQLLQYPAEIILALQLVGASMGNAICLFNIIAAAAVADVKNFSGILKINMLPVLIAGTLSALAGYLILRL
jgi:lactate permease